eukprot:Hpha_TRINITY_DN5590_c0_g1::TRINITY_DN5590_c0_g1_i1::g.93743::m.93743
MTSECRDATPEAGEAADWSVPDRSMDGVKARSIKSTRWFPVADFPVLLGVGTFCGIFSYASIMRFRPGAQGRQKELSGYFLQRCAKGGVVAFWVWLIYYQLSSEPGFAGVTRSCTLGQT